MPRVLAGKPVALNVAELLEQLGGIPPARVRLWPLPGTAKEQHIIEIDAHEDRLCELVDGVLVEKPMGALESMLAMKLGRLIGNFVEERNLGVVLGEAGMLRLRPRLVRIPDVSFIAWESLPGDEFPNRAIPDVAPDLAVEVLSESNTPGEMIRKLREYGPSQ